MNLFCTNDTRLVTIALIHKIRVSFISNCLHWEFSIKFKLCDFASNEIIFWISNQFLVTFALWWATLSCWNMNLWLWWWQEKELNYFLKLYFAAFCWSSNTNNSTFPFSVKALQMVSLRISVFLYVNHISKILNQLSEFIFVAKTLEQHLQGTLA